MTKPRQQPGDFLCCPSCGKPKYGVDMRNGDQFLRCIHNVGFGATRRRCNQHFYVIASARVCAVFAVTREQYDRFRAVEAPPEQILAEIGANLLAPNAPLAPAA